MFVDLIRSLIFSNNSSYFQVYICFHQRELVSNNFSITFFNVPIYSIDNKVQTFYNIRCDITNVADKNIIQYTIYRTFHLSLFYLACHQKIERTIFDIDFLYTIYFTLTRCVFFFLQ